jgi:hypothetical protein
MLSHTTDNRQLALTVRSGSRRNARTEPDRGVRNVSVITVRSITVEPAS